VLAQDFLGRFNYLLDYRARQVVFDDGGSLASALLCSTLPCAGTLRIADLHSHWHLLRLRSCLSD
jgi:hypothetical protein